MTELAMRWFQATWGREALRQRIERINERYEALRRLAESILATNRAQANAIGSLERQNQELTEQLELALRDSSFIDPNAKCPGCGACEGFLTHVAKNNEVRIVNNCKRCGLPFVSSEPVAGAEACARAYQAPLGNERAQLRE